MWFNPISFANRDRPSIMDDKPRISETTLNGSFTFILFKFDLSIAFDRLGLCLQNIIEGFNSLDFIQNNLTVKHFVNHE